MTFADSGKPRWVYTSRWPTTAADDGRRRGYCSYHLFTGARQDMGGHQCARKATTTREGYPVCAAHSEQAEASRRDRADAQAAAQRYEWAKADARKERELFCARHFDGLVAALESILACGSISEAERIAAAAIATLKGGK